MTDPFVILPAGPSGASLGASGDLHGPWLPSYDPTDVVENAVVSRLAGNWGRRASVKRSEPELDDLFDPAKADIPEELIPFRDHDRYRGLDDEKKNRLRAWGWIAYNKNVIDIEQYVVNPGFSVLSQDAFGTGLGDPLMVATMQAMVDEQYHSLMHLNASILTREKRGLPPLEKHLPYSLTVRRHHAVTGVADDPRERALTSLAFTTVAETSISEYLGLITENEALQPVNRATVALHRRDEVCHASISGELLKMVYEKLSADDRRILLNGLAEGVAAFTGNDFSTWSAILGFEGVAGAEEMIHDVQSDRGRQRLGLDCSAIRRLCDEIGISNDIEYEW